MSEPEVIEEDQEMETMPDITADDDLGASEPTGLEYIEPTIVERIGFIDYLKSSIVDLRLGSGDEQVVFHAHQALLEQSQFLAGEIQNFTGNARCIDMPDDDVNACASVLEFIYRGDYFPTLVANTMEYDPTVPAPDDSGTALLRHARVYTLAQRFKLPTLSALAHKKIHLTSSTAKGEIAYARFEYRG